MQQLTAIVTGASEGLGKSFAFELAGRGINLVLVALPGPGLCQLSAYIRKNFGVRADCFHYDLTGADNCAALFDSLRKDGITVDILINNAGLGNRALFRDNSIAFYKKQIELNVIAPVLLTRLFLDQIDRSRTSYLLNVGSLGGQFLVPKKQVYGSTKSFIRYFTRSLQLELSGHRVAVCLLSPGGINTRPELLVLNQNLRGLARASVLEAEQVAKAAIDGMLSGKKEIIPGALNRLLVLLDALLPAVLKNVIIRRRLGTVMDE